MKNKMSVRIVSMIAALALVSYALLGNANLLHALTGFVGCKPIAERTGEMGCWIIQAQPLGLLPKAPIYWSLDLYPTRAAAMAAKGPRSTVVEALGKIWLFTIDHKSDPPAGTQRVTQIGPLPIKDGESYTAQYMEAILTPGSVARTHRHPGPEAFYTETGESCLETPDGKTVGRRGVDVIVPEGQPMSLAASGTETRRSIVVVLHPSNQAWMNMAEDWKPKGLCKN